MLVEGLYALLTNSTALKAIVGNRITMSVLPKNPTFPAITFKVISGVPTINLDQTATTVSRVEIDCWAMNYLPAAQAQQALHTLLDGFIGTLPDGTSVIYTTTQDGPDFYEPDSLLYRSSLDVFFTV